MWMYRDPRDHDAAAAINDTKAAKMNAAVRPEWNGAEIRSEKNECPVSSARLAGDRWLSTFEPTSVWIGL